ncbi:acyltransferase family protein [Mucilaginibacter sp. SP1R1]|uniref:acyltransferase family protein n=1 Tax=Mucilaginibacter sp. SP1R1 TaxID=2723091 RepID=UPI00161684A9|nr:acyltransferase [Mucilaginibacter sp. SP1R1]MBB6147599.1 peptidoglycan/LPS O-acetylase OafA/YrhL [Mucilaginibacter sp. SP1R1]
MSSPTFHNPVNKVEKHKLLGLDHLRAFAIVYVLLFHYQMFGHPTWENKIGGFGWTGVDLFFVLSGFLISGQLFDAIAKGKTISVKEFFAKRFFRIIPPYLVVLTLYATLPFLREREHMAALWRYLTFTLNFGLDLHQTGTFTHAWSLCVEEQFYLIVPLAFWGFNYFKIGKKAVYLLSVLFVGGFVIRHLGWTHGIQPHLSSDNWGALWNMFIYYPTYNRLDGLLIGVSIAGMYTFYPHIKAQANRYSNLLMLAGIITLIAAYFACTPQASYATTVWGFPLISLGYGLVVAAIVCPAGIFYNLKSKITSQLATLSYGIYLVHKLMIHLTQNLLEKAGLDKNSNLMMLCCIMSSIAGALVLRYAIEKPSLKLRDKVLQHWKNKKVEVLAEAGV